MTLDQLLIITSKEWESLSTEEIQRILEPHLLKTRPPVGKQKVKEQKDRVEKKQINNTKRNLMRLKAKLGDHPEFAYLKDL